MPAPSPAPVSLLIAAARRRLKRAVTARVAPFRLTSQQFWVLINVAEDPGVSVQRIARMRQMDEPTASRLVRALLLRKLLRTKTDPEDRRRLGVFLTAKGRQLVRKLAPLAAEFRETVVRGLSAEEQQTLRALLERVIANMEAFAPEEQQ